VGAVLGDRYVIERRLGEGGMGVVFRASQVRLRRGFAVKVLHACASDGPKMLRRFEREAEVLGRLRHPNLTSIVDVGETSDRLPYMVMELAEGESLATVMNGFPLGTARTIGLVRQLLAGLGHAHTLGLVHRDLKPENVIVERAGEPDEVPRIVDFGIALASDPADAERGRLTTAVIALGTPPYIPPPPPPPGPIDGPP